MNVRNNTDGRLVDWVPINILPAQTGFAGLSLLGSKSRPAGSSAQTALNTKTITSLSIVAFDVQPGYYDFELDEVGFY